jgi:hypothetical protein
MKRYYVSPMAWIDHHGWAPKVATFEGVDAWSAQMPPDPSATGAMAFVVVEAKDHTKILADTAIKPLPEFSFDSRLAMLSSDGSKQLNEAVTAIGLNPVAVRVQSNDYRDVIRKIGQVNTPSFSENNFDASVS